MFRNIYTTLDSSQHCFRFDSNPDGILAAFADSTHAIEDCFILDAIQAPVIDNMCSDFDLNLSSK